MQNSALVKRLAALMVLMLVSMFAWHFFKGHRPIPKPEIPNVPAERFSSPQFVFQHPKAPKKKKPILDAVGIEKIPREKVEEWLARHNRNAMSLLAAFRALNDTNYLNEAATNFPNNPQVELAVLAHDEFPQDRHKWLDLFKASSPSNSLANYLSAQDDFKNGNPDAAVQELLAASGKSQFDAFLTESRLDEEDLYSSSGYSPLDSTKEGMSGMWHDDSPEMTTLKRLAQGIGTLQEQYLDSGDTDSAANLTQMGMTLANQINSGDSGKYLINQLVGIATESIVLQQLDPNTSYDFLDDQTPGHLMQESKQQLALYNQVAQSFDAVQPDMSESEMLDFEERVKIYGEVDAMKWEIQQHPANTSQNGQQ